MTRLSSLSDPKFNKLFRDCKQELERRVNQKQVVPKYQAPEQGKKMKMCELSESGFRVLILDLLTEAEKRWKFGRLSTDNHVDSASTTAHLLLSADTAIATTDAILTTPPDLSCQKVNRDSSFEMVEKRLTKLDLEFVKVPTSLTPPSSPSPANLALMSREGEEYDYGDLVLKVADRVIPSLGYLLGCYLHPPSPGLVVKQMKESISLLRDLSSATEEFMESLIVEGCQYENLIVFLDCMLELIGSSIKVIMANFSPTINEAAVEAGAIKLEINKVEFMVNALKMALAVSPVSILKISTLKEISPSLEVGSHDKVPLLERQTQFKELLKDSFKTYLVSVLISPSSTSKITSLSQLVHFLASQTTLFLESSPYAPESIVSPVKDAIQSLMAVCGGLRFVCDHDHIVEIMESVFEVERGVEEILEALQMKLPIRNSI